MRTELRWISLPVSVGSQLFSQWLRLQSIIALDRAGNNHEDRMTFLTICCNSSLKTFSIGRQPSFFLWLALRKLRVAEISANESSFVQFSRYFTVCGAFVRTIRLGKAYHVAKSETVSREYIVMLSSLGRFVPNLNNVHCSSCLGDIEAVALSGALRNVESLRLTFCTSLTCTGMNVVAVNAPLLKELTVTQGGVGDAGLLAIAQHCKLLQKLTFHDCQESETGVISALSSMHNLESLSLSQINTTIVRSVAITLSRLTTLCITRNATDLDNPGLQILRSRCPRLRHLTLSKCCPIILEGLCHLRNLDTLSLSSSENDDANDSDDENDNEVNGDDIAALLGTHHPHLTTLELTGFRALTNQFVLDVLRNCSALRSLTVSNDVSMERGVGLMDLTAKLLKSAYPRLQRAAVWLK